MKKLFINVFIILSIITLSSCKTKASNEDVKTDYQVQIDNSQVVSGKDDMKAFYEKTKSNIKATIKIIRNVTDYQTGNTVNKIKIVDYKNNEYKVKNDDGTEKKFKYLNYSIYNYGETANAISTEAYCLADNEEVDYAFVMRQMLSSSSLPTEWCDYDIVYDDTLYKDLCFYNSSVTELVYENSKFDIDKSYYSIFNLIDPLNWQVMTEETFNSLGINHLREDLLINTKRRVVNDKNKVLANSLPGKALYISYKFYFKAKKVVLSENTTPSKFVVAEISDDNIKKIGSIIRNSIYHNASGTNIGWYVPTKNESRFMDRVISIEDNFQFSIGNVSITFSYLNPPHDSPSTIIMKKTITYTTIEVGTYSIFDWKLHLTTKDNYEYLFELKKDGNGLSGWYYNATASRPNPLNAEYLLDNPFFTYVGLPVDVIYEN